MLLLGYEDQIVENVNPGRQILKLKLKLKDHGLDGTERAKSVAIENLLGKARLATRLGSY